jgi:hypothetical protein
MRNILCAALGAVLGAAYLPASAIALNPRGIGQVLIYPYYTTNAALGTLLSVTNTTNQGKALKVHVREGYNGRDVLAFNLYLSPYDEWVAQIYYSNGGGALATNDNSCTVPTFERSSAAPGIGVVNLSTSGYSGANADGGPTALSRTREGYIEIIEMGTITNGSHQTLEAITHTSHGVPNNCGQLVDAWGQNGYWKSDSGSDLAPPSGGLYGAESIINVGAGLIYAVNAEAIEGFSESVQHTAPTSQLPDLGSASSDENGAVSAIVSTSAGSVTASFPRAIDAVSALFMVEKLFNEYVIDSNLAAQSDWVLTLPTKRFYTDPALIGPATSALQPFDSAFGAGGLGASCSSASVQFWNREEMTTTSPSCGGLCPTQPPDGLCFATNVLPFGKILSDPEPMLGSSLLYVVKYNGYIDPSEADFRSGHARMDLTVDADGASELNHVLIANGGVVLHGLPAVGFGAIDYINGNVTPGTLANYSGAYPHRATVNCTKKVNNAVLPCN